MYLILIIIIIIVLLLFQKTHKISEQKQIENNQSYIISSTAEEKKNDKIILVNGVSHEDLKEVLIGSCKLYNVDKLVLFLRLFKLSENENAIIFPFDIDFETLCYFLNYLKYPMEKRYNADINAWVTTKRTDTWITEPIANKNVMLFISDDDKEHDNVFLTTFDNIGYKIKFDFSNTQQLLDQPKKYFVKQPIALDFLIGKQYVEFK